MAAQINERIAAMKEQGAKEISFSDMKAMLATTAMKLKATKELAVGSALTDIHKHHNPVPKPVISPAIEPPQRAAPGNSFAQ